MTTLLNEYPQVGLNADWNDECRQVTETLFIFADAYDEESFSVIRRLWDESEDCNNDESLFYGADFECINYIKELTE